MRYGQPMKYTLECVLPLNMFNEKIFVFFYFWLLLLFGTTVISIVLWFVRLARRRNFYQRLLALYVIKLFLVPTVISFLSAKE